MLVDLHCHVLHGLDDGAKTIEESLLMARRLFDVGFRTVVATPHAGYASADEARARQEELARRLEEAAIPLSLELGAENYFSPEFLADELAGRGRHLGMSACTLVEIPFEGPVPALPEHVFRLRQRGIAPLFAHPERCIGFDDLDKSLRLAEQGARFQLDLGSLIGVYGSKARKSALRNLEAGLYSVAATDLHRMETTLFRGLEKALKALEAAAGADACDRLLARNPARLLEGGATE